MSRLALSRLAGSAASGYSGRDNMSNDAPVAGGQDAGWHAVSTRREDGLAMMLDGQAADPAQIVADLRRERDEALAREAAL